ncbi:hypothetical protein PPL_11931 [Heterostelium album PN500]|uniref:SET domain-containing protein n=1 Tax=Heterostelium pallidum (strain ATCC 26659 / Pp 5 / PN500) TaxID=670386 RepID=D3BUV9_HETP5|nr:hypothetical protein PPL_11931 [Heterostelium album PN500]EFA74897.1 hypothetical protein PPL_11931 [Heterostelium album PN500]|eukprot:XP_020427031.1 hypothetical protein PPL_11931 [Heterostelium album PN500]
MMYSSIERSSEESDEEIDIFSEIEDKNIDNKSTSNNNFIICNSDDAYDGTFEFNLDNNPYIKIEDHPIKGRCVVAKRFIPRGTTLLIDKPYVSGDYYYCFKYFSELNRQNVVCCPGCGEIYYCSTFCKHSRFKETKHSDLECKWMYYFSKTYLHQLLDDEKDMVLIILRILARRQQAKLSMDFTRAPTSSRLDLPSEINDLVDHIDEYFSVSLEHQTNDNNNNNTQQQQQYIVKNEIINNQDISINRPTNMNIDDYKLVWQHDFAKLLTLTRIIQNIITPSKNCSFKSNIDRDGDFEMTDTTSAPTSLRTSLEVITKTDFNLLKLLGKIRSNYFGLWTHSPMPIIGNTNSSFNQTNTTTTTTMESSSSSSTSSPPLLRPQQCHWGGAAVYLRMSLFNHSCFPNCTTLLQTNDTHRIKLGNSDIDGADSTIYELDPERVNPLSFHVVTIRDIEVDTECLITYIPLDQKLKDRQSHLKSMWLFDCNCQRCQFDLYQQQQQQKSDTSLTDNNQDTTTTKTNLIPNLEFEKYCCNSVGCHSGMLVPDYPGSTTGSCRECNQSFQLPK